MLETEMKEPTDEQPIEKKPRGKTTHVKLLWAVRDTQALGKVDLAVMYAIILRGKYSNKFKCFPSYELLAQDTSYDRLTVMKSAGRLHKMGWIDKQKRANKSCIFAPKTQFILNMAEAVIAARKKALEDLGTSEAERVVEGGYQGEVES